MMSRTGLFFASLIVAAVGAVLTWGVTGSVSGLDLNTIGLIVLAAGVIGCISAAIALMAGRPSVVAYEDDRARVRDRDRYAPTV